MYAQIESPKENKSKAITNAVAQKKSNVKQSFGFVDFRPGVAQMKRLHVLASSSQRKQQVVQLQGIEEDIIQRKKIEAKIIGLTHLVKSKNESIFEGSEYQEVTHGTILCIDNDYKIRSRRGPNQEVHTEDDRLGPQNYRWIKVLSVNGKSVPGDVFVRADTISVDEPAGIAPSALIGPSRERLVREKGPELEPSGEPEHELDPKDEAGWDQLDKYLTLTVAVSEKQQVKKVEGFDLTKYPDAARQYINQFQIISKKQFDRKVTEIALGIIKLGAYTCIISEVGKSNFWLTGKVLDQVRRLGGRPPRRVVSLPVKEKGTLDTRTEGQFADQLNEAGHIVFIDDGSYSGNQLVKFINHVIGQAALTHSIGLVAGTDKALDHVQQREGQKAHLLTEPIKIGSHVKAPLDEAYDSLKLPLHDKDGEPEDGNALAALYYKVPDYASVRYKMLVGNSGNPGPIEGYQKGSEPYKSKEFTEKIEAAGTLSDLGIESQESLMRAKTKGLNLTEAQLNNIEISEGADDFLLRLNNHLYPSNIVEEVEDIKLTKQDVETFFEVYKDREDFGDYVGEYKSEALKKAK